MTLLFAPVLVEPRSGDSQDNQCVHGGRRTVMHFNVLVTIKSTLDTLHFCTLESMQKKIDGLRTG